MVVLLALAVTALAAACVRGPTLPGAPDDADNPSEEDTVSVTRAALGAEFRGSHPVTVRLLPPAGASRE